jgi:hypothetical protein
MVEKFVLQPLTVLFSYEFEASVPLWDSALEWKMASVRSNSIVLRTKRGIGTMPSAYATWVGQAVVLQVAAGDLRVPLRGVIIGESDGAVRFRIGEGWDIDIYKPMILAVEEDNWASILTN